ncbi:hypothetical protein ASPWEDRAFT_41153 [Aspergillus wentii DTO 134E9]|uniref:Concanavalin A-like lectin/glucanase n=1 Tax=Aspergillus wentii DTO 134E9 TaxID=1073089 RepID=A0A1L9RLW9_ASPWE|nr:uncharacterized protein ASPWEDRAFT_41153 [Aspergillus wentii DTO 134E9]KAI9929630.1 hypothetical protein MW887_001104 [Aspergillus wentii]OJJ35922.1 hypothetical protein ASPWEDRAFT_41153 [Aspergillus wentii DTO 134E9]
MKPTLLVQTVFISLVVASPYHEQISHPLTENTDIAYLHRSSKLLQKFLQPNHSTNIPANLDVGNKNSKSKTELSKNWAGAVLDAPQNSAFSYISATLTVPKPSAIGSSDYQAASAWVGIDGLDVPTALLQTGININIINGEPSYNAWYQWYPSPSVNFDIPIHKGDVIVATVNVTSPSAGICQIENHTTKQIESKNLTAPDATATLAGRNAEWIVEDFKADGRRVDFVDFGQLEFHGCTAITGGDRVGNYRTYGLGDRPTIYELVRDEEVVTDVHVISPDTLGVVYKN